jgi:hypothetical protein
MSRKISDKIAEPSNPIDLFKYIHYIISLDRGRKMMIRVDFFLDRD